MELEGQCAQCSLKNRICRQKDGFSPKFCSTVLYAEVIEKAAGEYDKSDVRRFACQASLQEAECIN